MRYSKEVSILIFLIILVIAINYNYFDGLVTKSIDNREQITVSRIIDGDTVVDSNGLHYRMLGINTPEKGEKYSKEAGNYTSSFVLNKTISIESKGKDLYDRELAYLFYNNENINQKLVEQGYANYYFPEGKEEYYNDFVNAWNQCIAKNINLCEKSTDKCAGCVVLQQFEYGKDVILYNKCGFDCNISGWSIKDEGRKKFIFKNFILKNSDEVSVSAKDFGYEYVWTKTGDTLFLRDAGGKLVLWEGY